MGAPGFAGTSYPDATVKAISERQGMSFYVFETALATQEASW